MQVVLYMQAAAEKLPLALQLCSTQNGNNLDPLCLYLCLYIVLDLGLEELHNLPLSFQEMSLINYTECTST